MRTMMFISMQGSLLYSKSFRQNFEKLGYIVVEPKYLIFREQNFVTKEIPSRRKKFKQEFFHRQNQLYIEACRTCNPAFVFVMNDSRITEEFLDYCEEQGIYVYQYLTDSIRFIATGTIYRECYKRIFSYEPSDTVFNGGDVSNIEYLPLCCDDSVYKPLGDKKTKYDVCFVGRVDKKRLGILEKIAKYLSEIGGNLVVYTRVQLTFSHIHLWPKILIRKIKYWMNYPHLMKCLHAGGIYGQDLVNLYAESKICLNIHVGTDEGMHTGPNPRTFEILGCKAFELIDKEHLKGIDLQDGKDLVEYDGTDDLIAKIDFYLKHNEEREKIAKNGYKKVIEQYTIEKAIKHISEIIEKDLQGR